ncbi:MAG: CHAT domain-containing protein [Nodosilinea sp.]
MPVIQEFQVSITPLRGSVNQDSYLLRTETVAKGVPLAETQVVWPVERWLRETAQLAQDPLQRLLTASASEGPEVTGLVRPGAALRLGQDLYHHLFQDQLRDSWLAAQGVAQNRQQPLRLRLEFKDSRLQRLPWELLYGDDRPLATGMDVTLCRCFYTQNAVNLAVFPPLAEATESLKVLVVVSAPEDQERLALSREITYLQTELRSSNPVSPIQNSPRLAGLSLGQPLNLDLTLLAQPGRTELVQALEQGDFQMLHYAGHSDVSETGGDLFLVNPQTGLTEMLSGEDLAGLLVNNGIWLAVFNSCRGAYTPATPDQGGWREQNLVQALVGRGVPGFVPAILPDRGWRGYRLPDKS